MWIYAALLLLIGIEVVGIDNINRIDIINGQKKRIKIKKVVCTLICIEVILFASLRGYSVGADTRVYLNALEYYRSLPHDLILQAELVWPYDFEPGYFLLTKVCSWLNMNNTQFLFVVAVLVYVPIFMFIYKYSCNPYISLLVYFSFGMFSYSLGIFRQMIAVSICLMSVDYIKTREFWKFLVCVLVAMSFHTTAIIFLIMYFLSLFDLSKFPKLVFLASIISLVFGSFFMRIAVFVFPQYRSYWDQSQSGGTYFALILYAISYLTYSYIIRKRKACIEEKIIINAIAIAMILQGMSYSVSFFGRVVYYFSVFLLPAIPNLLFKLIRVKKSMNFVLVTFIIVMCALFFMEFHNNQYVTPYTTFFMDMK